MKKILVLIGCGVQTCCVYAAITALAITSPIQNLVYPKEKMAVFQVINKNPTNVQAGALAISPFATSPFAKDKLISQTFNPDISAKIELSPKEYVLAPKASQSIRFFINQTLPQGDHFFVASFRIDTTQANLQPTSQSHSKGQTKVDLGIFLDQNSTVYIHNGKGTPQVSMTCQVLMHNQAPALNLTFKNSSIWMLRPRFNISQQSHSILQKVRVVPMMGMTEGTRQIELPSGIKGPVDLTWTSEQGISGGLTCAQGA